jgi:Glycosyl transferase family 11
MKLNSCWPNPLGKVGFLMGWEPAFLGNCLTSLANLVVWSLRTTVPILYPHIEDHRGIFADQSRSRAIFDPAGVVDQNALWAFNAVINPIFDGYFPGYAGRTVSTDYAELASFQDACGTVLFLPYHYVMNIRDWSENEMEARTAAFCARGNGLVLPGAYWNQYMDMREAAAYGPVLREHIGALKPDGCAARRNHMAAHLGHLKIAIHIRQSDYSNWSGGAYYYGLHDYLAIMRHIDRTLASVPHIFYVFSEIKWSADDFAGLPVLYEASDFLDDFVSMGQCDHIVGPPSTFASWSAFLGGAKRIIITRPRIAALPETRSLLDFAVTVPFPTGAYLPGDPQARPL